MDAFDNFVEKVCTQNKIVSPKIMPKAKALMEQHGIDLLTVLIKTKKVPPRTAEQIRNKYEEMLAKNPPPEPEEEEDDFDDEEEYSVQEDEVEIDEDDEEDDQPAPARPVASGELGKDVSGFTTLEEFLAFGRSINASDVHIVAEGVPHARVNGALVNLNCKVHAAEDTEKILFPILPDEKLATLQEEWVLDTSISIEGQGRYRSCFVKHQRGYDGAFRVVDAQVPTLKQLGLPPELRSLTEWNQGLVLVTGPAGSGKTTTVAALLDLVNENRDDHIITIEDPVEFMMHSKGCHVSQRQVGDHTDSFSAALRAALREDPDIIMIGEMRDTETASLAISASETGHLVFTTLHTTSAARTIGRITDLFPPDQQGQIRSMISESIRGIICQRLLPRKDGKGRALALEVLYNAPAISNIIRENRMVQLPSVMQMNAKEGMRLMDKSLEEMVQAGVITGDTAYYAAENPQNFEKHRTKKG